MILKTTTIWASFIPLAILNGLLREKCLVPLICQRIALPLSDISGGVLFFLLTYFTLSWSGCQAQRLHAMIVAELDKFHTYILHKPARWAEDEDNPLTPIGG